MRSLPNLTVFLVLGPTLGLTFVAYRSSMLDTCHRLARPDMLGRTISLVTLGTLGTTPIGSVLMRLVIDAWSPRVATASARPRVRSVPSRWRS